ncbi:hypothetical protein [Anaeromyxobacter terrae]|nr:hypothetical protein [Anaeromyxobacter sp. SG22]
MRPSAEGTSAGPASNRNDVDSGADERGVAVDVAGRLEDVVEAALVR